MARGRAKITVVGGGNVGATTAHWAAAAELGDVVLVDIPKVESKTKGKALDLAEAGPIVGFDARLVGTASYEDAAGSDVVVITAGVPRKPGMSRDDLVGINAGIVRAVAGEVKTHCPDAVLIVVSNPLDAMAHVAREVTGFPRERIVGMAGVLDTGRYRTFVAEAVGCSVEDVTALVLGGHGDTMVPLPRYTMCGGIPLAELLPAEKIAAIVQRTRDGGAEIVKLYGDGSAYYAPAAAIAQMIEAILRDKKRILPCAAWLEGEYGHKGIFLGVPCLLGARGVERVIELALTPEEKAALDKSAAAVRELVVVLGKVGGAG
jgi:malate dehydrogenase